MYSGIAGGRWLGMGDTEEMEDAIWNHTWKEVWALVFGAMKNEQIYHVAKALYLHRLQAIKPPKQLRVYTKDVRPSVQPSVRCCVINHGTCCKNAPHLVWSTGWVCEHNEVCCMHADCEQRFFTIVMAIRRILGGNVASQVVRFL